VLRGKESDLFPAQVLAEMAARGPRAQTVEFEGVGHAPTLMHADQIGVVKEFLNQHASRAIRATP
jgi:pimeloyl-ACP methyl ester carboxylesterase